MNPIEKLSSPQADEVANQSLAEQKKAEAENIQSLSPKEQEQLKELEELKDELNTIVISEDFVAKYSTNLENALLRDGDPKDKEYQSLQGKVARLKAEFETYKWREEELSSKIREIQNAATEQISTLKNESEKTPEQRENEEIQNYIKERAEKLWVEEKFILTILGWKDISYPTWTVEERKEEINNCLDSIKGELVELKEITDPKKRALKISEIMAKTNPEDFVKRTKEVLTQTEPWSVIKLFNSLLKAFFWIDFLKNFTEGQDQAWNALQEYVAWKKSNELWSLSELFESAGKWPYALNFDDNWSASFWTYQLRADKLRDFAKENQIDWYEKWKLSNDHEFTKNWKAKVESLWVDEFKKREHEFIKETHFDKQMSNITDKAWIDASKFSMTMQNVIWSVAVQHWPDTSLIVDVLKKLWDNIVPWKITDERKLVEALYTTRSAKYSSLASRYSKEKQVALSQLLVFGLSEKGEKSDNWTTLCSRTARKNLTKFWVENPAWWSSAKNSFNRIPTENKKSIQSLMDDPKINVIDVYLDASEKNKEYWHRAVAVRESNGWKIFDPYYSVANWINWVSANKYIDHMIGDESVKKRKMWLCAWYSVDK